MMQRTYAVFGLMEYTINVTLGARLLKIPFTGGIASKDGVRPATYTTSNPVVQFAIESSKHFKSGRVKVFKTIGEAAPDAISVSEAKAETEKAATEKLESETSSTELEDIADKTKTDDEVPESSTVEVSCLDDAREYLINNCGGKALNLRSKKAILEYAADHNVVFVGLEA